MGLRRPYRYLYLDGMKTTLNLDDHLVARAKAVAAEQRTSLTRLIEEGLRMRLDPPSGAASPRGRSIPVLAGQGGLVAGIDPTSNRALLDALDDDA